ncbi:MAG: hypothetical protein E7564_06040 [Ruminococcaceae bacterium]|nr:hypothetical protein [Oscillospiraceae bacterium]
MSMFDLIKERYKELLFGGNLAENTLRMKEKISESELLYNSLIKGEAEGTYFWGDINYACQNRAMWDCANHYSRMLSILIENGTERLIKDEEYRIKMTGALKFWLEKDFINSNWWHNDIGTPGSVGDITIILSDFLDRETLNKAVNIISRGSMATRSDISEKWTGTNLLWGGVNTVKHALLIKDSALVLKAVNRISDEIRIDKEGIQPDGSFFQHGRRLYSGGYGRSFAYDIAKLAYYLQGSEYQFSNEKLSLFLTHVLDGVRYMTRGDALDFAAINRELAREDAVKTGLIKRALGLMVNIEEMPRKEEIKAYLNSISGKEQFEGTKLFPHAMMLCHHSKGVYVGAKFTSDKLWDQDTCNGEGELCLNMTYGTHTNIMRDGSEYLNIAPLWDFSKIPGTTARNETDEELQSKFDKHNWCCDPLPNDHFGCRQKGNKALIFEKAQHDFISAFVTDFAFEGGFVSLGAGIKDEKGQMLTTTIDQCNFKGEVIRENESIIHHKVRYTPLENTKAQYSVIHAEGDWKRVDKFRRSKKAKGDILLITIDHCGENEKENKYAYMVSSGERDVPRVKVIKNDEKAQAILTHDNKIMAVFHENTSFIYCGKEYAGNKKEIIIEE